MQSELACTHTSKDHTHWLTLTLSVALAYWFFAFLADFLSYPGALTAVWPASGIAAFAVLAYGYRALTGILLGVYLNQLSWIIRATDQSDSLPLLDQFLAQSQIGVSYAVGNMLEAALLLFLVRRFISSKNPLTGISNLVRFIALAAMASPIIGSICGVLVTCGLWGWTPWSDFWSSLWTWWVSAAVGILIVTPPLLFLHHDRSGSMSALLRNMPESVLLVGAAIFVLFIAFFLNFPFEYLLLPILLWAAFRFGPSVTSWLGLVMMFCVIVFTTHGYGPFAADATRLVGNIQSLTILQCFVATLISTALIVSVILIDRRQMSEQLHKINLSLEERVMARTRELTIARQEADEANRAKSQFITAASHDLQQPLRAMQLFVDALIMELHGGNKVAGSTTALDTLTQKLAKSLTHLHKLFNKILLSSTQEVHIYEPHIVWVDTKELLKSIEHDIAPRAIDQGFSWQLSCATIDVQSDPIMLERVIRNLLDNAVKYAKKGTISVKSAARTNAFEIVISDTGCGFTNACCSDTVNTHLNFELNTPTENGNGNGNGNGNSFGLGLSIVSRLCRILNHTLKIDSIPGQGTTIIIKINEFRPSSESTSQKKYQRVNIDSQLPKNPPKENRILIIHASRIQNISIEQLLVGWGYEVQQKNHNDTLDIVELITIWKPDLLLATSYEAASSVMDAIREAYSGVSTNQLPCIVLNDKPEYRFENYEGKVLQLHAEIKPARLRSAIRSCLRGNTETALI